MKTSAVLTIGFNLLFFALRTHGADPAGLTPEKALQIAESQNPEIKAAQARADSESSLVPSAYWLDRPRLGLMREQNLNDMQVQAGPMTFWSISQDIKFPAKYLASGSAQSSRADAAAYSSDDKRLEIRQRVLSAYFAWYSAQRITALLTAQRETLKEIARAAEARRATGSVPQQDEMKAHVEQTRLENEIILQNQETIENEAAFRALLNQTSDQELMLTKTELKAPKIVTSLSGSGLLEKARTDSRSIQIGQAMLNEAQSQKTLAWLGLSPDFTLTYRQAFVNAPQNAYAIGIEATIPLWFFSKEIPELKAARSRAMEAEGNLERMKRDTESDARSLGSKVESYSKLLQIYETSLIPQSTSTLNSSRAAYSAGRTTFIELLDSERSLYSNRISYYQTLTKYVESLTRLERVLASSISDLPFSGEKR